MIGKMNVEKLVSKKALLVIVSSLIIIQLVFLATLLLNRTPISMTLVLPVLAAIIIAWVLPFIASRNENTILTKLYYVAEIGALMAIGIYLYEIAL